MVHSHLLSLVQMAVLDEASIFLGKLGDKISENMKDLKSTTKTWIQFDSMFYDILPLLLIKP